MRQKTKFDPENGSRWCFLGFFVYMNPPVYYMCRISIPAIWDVIWGQINLFPTSDRPPNPLSRKDRDSKNWIFDGFWLSQELLYIPLKYLVRK